MPRETYVWRNGELVPKHLAPPLHAPKSRMQVIKDIEPYRAIGVDNRIVGGRRQHREMLRSHGLVEIGSESQTQRAPENRVDHGLIQDLKRAMNKL